MQKKPHYTLLIAIILLSSFLCPARLFSQTVLLPDSYFAWLQQKIASNLIYPLEAKNNDWEGVVKVKITLTCDGQIKELIVAESSGYPLLDEAAISAVQKASPYPFLDYETNIQEIEIVLPITYGQEEALEQPYIDQGPLAVSVEVEGLEEIKPETEEQIDELAAWQLEEAIDEDAAPEMPPADQLTYPEGSEKSDYIETSQIAQPLEELVLLRPVANLGQADELGQFIQLAIKNNQPTQIAQEETMLAQLKVKESHRNFYPALKLLAYNTQGEVYNLEYEEREAKIQLDQPIYYGGRLRNNLNQSKVNWEITKRNYDRLKIDVSHKAEVGYYNLVAAQMNLNTQERIRDEAEKLLKIVENLYAAELITPLELASAQSWYEQICFQIESIKQDKTMAELTFVQILNISQAPQITRQELIMKEASIDLGNCLGAGLRHRPEIILSKLLVEFSKYGKAIEDSKNSFNIDFTSSYGYYEGAYETEEMSDSSNWYIGFKATKPWGANTTNFAATTDEAQPRFGQTSPTKSSTISAEFNLLNNLQRLSEQKESEIGLQKAISDLNETKKTINFEIKDAYLNQQKALLQAATTRSESAFRLREAEVLKVRAQVGEVGLASVLEAMLSLSRAQSSYIQALANYFISLANLKKATGYGIKI